MRNFSLFYLMAILILSGLACKLGDALPISTPTLVETDACCLNIPPKEAILASPTPFPATPTVHSEAPPTAAILASPTPHTTESPAALPGEVFWANRSFSDSETADPDFASGAPDVTDCTQPMQPTWAPMVNEQPETLTLSYLAPVHAGEVEIIYIGQPAGILRVEVQNSLSGLGQLIYEGKQSSVDVPINQCPASLSLPVKADFDIDLVIVTVAASEIPVQIDAVGIKGELLGYVELPVYWRVPLPGTPHGLAAAPGGLVYAAVEPNGLWIYDVEGNQLKTLPLLSDASLSDVATDAFGNLMAIDEIEGRLIVLSPEGQQLSVGGQNLYGRAAVSPQDGNLYLLKAGELLIYTTDTAELVHQVQLDDLHSFMGLTFSLDGRLFTLRDFDWDPTLCQLDSLTGEELDAIPLLLSNQSAEIVARDLATDASGNFYILFSMNAGQVAVHMLNPQGNLIRRFGRLTFEMDDWSEGTFFTPREITVTPDGRFILIADGFGDTAYLTAFLVERE